MPTQVPYTGVPGGSLYEREESIHENPTPDVRVQAPPQAFGTDVAEATQHLGQVSENAGKELFDRAYAMQELNAHTNAANINVNIQNRTDDAKVQFSQLEGVAAKNAFPAYQAQLDKIRTDELAKATPYEQNLVNADSRSTIARAKMAGAQYAGSQFKKYQDDTDNATVDAAVRNMALDPNSTDVNMGKITAAINSKYDRRGVPTDNPMRIEETKKVLDVAGQAQVNAMLRADNPAGAKQTFDAMTKSGMLFSNDSIVLGERIRKATAAKDAIDSGRASMTGAPTAASPVAPPATFFTDRAAPGHTIDAEHLQPGFAARLAPLVQEAEQATGQKVQFTSGFRTYAEQQALANNEPGSGRVGPAAAPGTSLHERGLAMDMAAGPARDYVKAHAAEYGLATVPGDPEHIEIARAGAGTAVRQVHTSGAADRVAGGGVLGVLINAESRGQNIVSGTDSDSHGLKASQGGNASEISQGYFQIQNHPGGTWATYAKQAGVDLSKYPSPRSAPYDVQWQVAQTIPVAQWGQRTKDLLRASGYVPLPGETLGQMNARYGGSSVQGQGVSPVDLSSSDTTIYHSTLTPEDAMDRPLVDKLADARAQLDKTSSANDPDAWDQTQKYVEAQDARYRKEITDMTQRNERTVMQVVYSPDNKATTVEELRKSDPKLAEAIDSLHHYNPEAIGKIQAALDKQAKAPVAETPERLRAYGTLRGMAKLGDPKFMNVDIPSLDLPMAWKKELLDLQTSGKPPADENVAAAFRRPEVMAQLQDLGINAKDTPQDYYGLAASVDKSMQQFTVDNGRRPNDKETGEIISRWLQATAYGWGGGVSQRRFQAPAPAKWAEQKRAEVQAEEGITPTDSELNRAWQQMKYQEDYGGTASGLRKAGAIPTNEVPPAGASNSFTSKVDTDLPGPNHIPNWGPWHAGGTPSGPIIPNYVPKGNQ